MCKVRRIMGVCSILVWMCLGIVVSAAEKNEELEIQYLSREKIINAKKMNYDEDVLLKWENYRPSKMMVHNGVIPVKLLDDDIYCSMNLPSESRSDENIRMCRDNGNVMSEMSEKHSTLTGMGAIYKTTNVELPDDFTLCLGKIKTFIFSKSVSNWLLIDEQPYPMGVYLYKMPWSEHVTKKCKNIKYYSDHIEIRMTDDEFKDYALHFWGKRTKVNQKDVLYVACAYDFWIKGAGCENKFTATIGIDAKDGNGSNASTEQLFYSRGLNVTKKRRTHWGQTIPNEVYDSLYDGHVLELLYNKWWNVSK